MNIEFIAQETSYSEAIDGEIVQAIFEEQEESDPLNPKYKSVCISINYEFPPRTLDVQWTDAEKLGGGRILQYKLNKTELQLKLEHDVTISVVFNTDSETHGGISALLLRELGEANLA